MTMEWKRESGRTAIAIMTAWASEPSGGDFTREQIANVITERGDEGISELIGGLVSIAGHLLVKTADATGRTEQEILQELGAKYA